MSVAKRSSAIKVIAILNLVGGFLGLLGSLINLVTLAIGPGAFSPPNAAQNPFDGVAMDVFLVANATGYRAFQYTSLGTSLILDILLIVSGFGLLYYKKWARGMAITYAVLSLLLKVALLVYQFVIFIPAMNSFIDEASSNAPPALQGVAGVMKATLYAGVIFSMVFAVYPVVVLSILLSKSGKAAFEPLPPEDDYEDEDEDDYDDRRDRFDDRDRPKRPRDEDRYGERDDRGGRY